MRKIQASEAKTHLPQLLDNVERGSNCHHPTWSRHSPDRAGSPSAASRGRQSDRQYKSIAAAHRKGHRRRTCLGKTRGTQVLMPFVLDASIGRAGFSMTKTILSLRWRLSASEPTRRASRAYGGSSAQHTHRERAPRSPDGERHGAFLHGLARLRVSVDQSPQEADVLALARRRRLTVYDSHILS